MRLRAQGGGGGFVPPRFHIRAEHAGVAGQRARRAAGLGGADLGQHPDQVWRDTRQGAGPGQQLPATSPVEQAIGTGGVQGGTQPGARFVGDRVQGQQRLAQPPVASPSEILQRAPGPFAEDCPLLGQQ